IVPSTERRKFWVFFESRSSMLKPRVFFAPAYASARTDRRPELENSGWVCPSLKLPHSECSKVPQPFGSAATRRRSDHPSDLPGHPSASAIGFQIAITIGERTTGSPAGHSALVCPATDSQFWFSSETYAPETGLKTWGISEPDRIPCGASPEPIP